MTENQAEVDRYKAREAHELSNSAAQPQQPSLTKPPRTTPTGGVSRLDTLKRELLELDAICAAISPEQRRLQVLAEIVEEEARDAVREEARATLFELSRTMHPRALEIRTEDAVGRLSSFLSDAMQGFADEDKRKVEMSRANIGLSSVIREFVTAR